MEKFKEKLFSIFKDKKLYVFIGTTLIFFGIFFEMQYTTDTYCVFTQQLDVTILTFLTSGRFVTAIFLYILMGVLKLGNTAVYYVSYIFAVLLCIISLYKLEKILQKYIKNSFISILATIMIIINIFSIELFMYIEKATLILSILMCVLATEQLQKFFEGKKKAIIYSFIFMLIANSCYQGIVGLFVVLGMFLVVNNSKKLKDFIINNILLAANYAVPALINLVIIKIFFNNSRLQSEIILKDSITKVLNGMENMIFNSYNLFPKYLFTIVVTAILIYSIYKILTKKQTTTNKVVNILQIFYIIIGTIVITIAPQFLQSTNSIWIVSRSTYSFASLIGILLAYLASITEVNKLETNIIVIIGIIILSVQFKYFNTYSIDNYIVNYRDKQDVVQIQEQIEKYENETGNIIKNIAIYRDKNPSYTYVGLHSTGDINVKSLAVDWAIYSILKYYTGKDLNAVEGNEEIKNEFMKNDWTNFNLEQIVFIGDTLHFCAY